MITKFRGKKCHLLVPITVGNIFQLTLISATINGFMVASIFSRLLKTNFISLQKVLLVLPLKNAKYLKKIPQVEMLQSGWEMENGYFYFFFFSFILVFFNLCNDAEDIQVSLEVFLL